MHFSPTVVNLVKNLCLLLKQYTVRVVIIVRICFIKSITQPIAFVSRFKVKFTLMHILEDAVFVFSRELRVLG